MRKACAHLHAEEDPSNLTEQLASHKIPETMILQEGTLPSVTLPSTPWDASAQGYGLQAALAFPVEGLHHSIFLEALTDY